MVTIKTFLEAVKYRITDGSNYLWHCFGPTVFQIDSENTNGSVITAVYNYETCQVFEMQAWDEKNSRQYRWVDPDYLIAVNEECVNRAVSFSASIDTNTFVDLESFEDFLEKAQAIANGVEYDLRVSIPIELPESELFVLMKLAHERDITLNELIENICNDSISADRRATLNTSSANSDNNQW